MIRVGQSYRKHPPRERFDVIVIGSGIGGLSTAALLAKHAGKRVLVLERHYMPGGFTHVFRRRGYEWDVGVHYIGGMGSRKSDSRRLFEHVTDGSVLRGEETRPLRLPDASVGGRRTSRRSLRRPLAAGRLEPRASSEPPRWLSRSVDVTERP